MSRWWLLLVVGACKDPAKYGPDGQTGGEVDFDGVGDADTDADADSDADTDADSDTDSDADSDADADTGLPPGTGATGDTADTADTADSSDTGLLSCAEGDPVSLWLSPDDSNSMASAALVRDRVLDGRSPADVRPWELLNYYSFDYPPAAEGSVAVDVQLAQDPDLGPGEYRLQVGVSSEERGALERRALNLALSLDTSCSMTGAGIERSKDVCRAIASSLVDGDTVSVVTWSTAQTTLLSGWPVNGRSDPILVDVCDGLTTGGATALYDGLLVAYDLVRTSWDPDKVNRVVLVSDGGANVGVTEADLIGDEAGANDEDGTYLVGVGVGDLGSYSDALMDTVTDLGRGASLYVGSTDEAWRMLDERFDEVMDVAVRDVEVRLDLPPGFEIVRTTAEAVSTEREEIPPQHLAPGDSMVFAMVIRTCDPASVTDDTPLSVGVFFEDDATFAPGNVEVARTFGELLAGDVRQLRRGVAISAYAEALRAPTADGLGEAYLALDAADALYPGDAELAEIRTVLDAL